MQQKQLLPRRWLTRLFEQTQLECSGSQTTAFCENDIDYDPTKTRRACGDTDTEDQTGRCLCFKACGKGLLTFPIRKDTVLSSACLRFLNTIPAILISRVGKEEAGILGILSAFEQNLVQIHSHFGELQLVLRGWSVMPTALQNAKSNGYPHPERSLLKVTLCQPCTVLRSSLSL